MASHLILLWLAAFPLMGSPGPATMSLAAMGAAFGGRRSLYYLAGIITGTFGVLVMIATGVTGVILAQPALVTAITIVAGAYILYLAFRIATAPVVSKRLTAAKAPSFYSGFILAIANPKAFAAIGAVYAGSTIVQNDLALDAVVKIAALTIVIITVNSAWLFFGSVFSSLLTNPRTARIANVTFAVMLVGSVILALLSG